MTAATPGRASWLARIIALDGEPDNGDDYAEISSQWDHWFDDEQRAAEEAGAQAAIGWQRAEDATPTAEDFDRAADVISGRAAMPGQAPDRETLIAAAAEIHDGRCGCDRKYRMSCPDMANAILVAGKRLREDAATPESAPVTVDINHLPVTPAAARLYNLCSAWEREAFRIPSMLGEKDARARALQDCSIALRAAVNDLRRDGEL